MKTKLRGLIRIVRDEVGRQELLIFGGLGVLAFGASQVSVAAAYMILGSGLLGIGLLTMFLTKRGE